MFLEKASRGNNRWYLYLATLFLVLLVQQIGSVPFLLYNNWERIKAGDFLFSMETSDNTGLALLMVAFVLTVLVLFFCFRVFHRKRITDVVTGRERFDWKRVLFAAGIWGIVLLLTMGIQLLVADSSSLVFQFEPARFLGLLVVALFFIPFQTGWEEIVFRGYLMQGFARLFRYRWIPLVITSLIFGLLHSSNPEVDAFGFWIMMPQYVLMGLGAGYLAIKDDGIELALGMHICNNLLACLVVTHESSALRTNALFLDTHPTVSGWDILVMAVSVTVLVWACNRKYRFFHRNRLSEKVMF